MTDEEVERLCIVMHNAYEQAAETEGWETQERSRKPWSEVPEENKATMRIAVRALLNAIGYEPKAPDPLQAERDFLDHPGYRKD